MGIFDELDQEQHYQEEKELKLKKYIDFWELKKENTLSDMYDDFQDFFTFRDYKVNMYKKDKRYSELYKCIIFDYRASAIKEDTKIELILSGSVVNDSNINTNTVLGNTTVLKVYVYDMLKPKKEYEIKGRFSNPIPSFSNLESNFDEFKSGKIIYSLNNDSRKLESFLEVLNILN